MQVWCKITNLKSKKENSTFKIKAFFKILDNFYEKFNLLLCLMN